MPGDADATLLSVFRHIVDHGPLTRPELGTGVGLARATTSGAVNDLMRRGLVAELVPAPQGGPQGRRGRPTALLDLDDERHAVAGLEIGIDRILSAVYSLRGRELLRTERSVEPESVNPRSLLRRAQTALREVLDAAEDDRRTLLGVGVSVPGLVDASTGTVKYVPSLGWRDVALRAGVDEALGGRTPVLVDGDANFAALAERRARLREGLEAASLIYLTGTYGISAGVIADGRLWRGGRGMAGEVGHLVVDPDGPACVCGRRGCFETRAGLSAITTEALEPAAHRRRAGAGRAVLSAAVDELVARARTGDERVCGVLAEAGRWIGRGAAALTAVLDPRVVVLGGHYARLAPWLLEPAREAFAGAQLVPGTDIPTLEVSAGADWAPTEGAALAVLMSFADGSRPLPAAD
ncbi:ROK family transcriptional regulator [Streptomyces formicae]|uniref:ROK family protein n=1 Tax=Streptomyces formicae TaxID=1616117 RepID=A0ABY3WKZ2_9ACTN|nr:ROK family transcriptional regulator [Streptomyces formicae]UNM12790.1 ROK family protein [Streptomyces formicae]